MAIKVDACASRNEIKVAMKSIQYLHLLISKQLMISLPLQYELENMFIFQNATLIHELNIQYFTSLS